MLVVDMFLYGFLAFYLDNVLPSKFGLSLIHCQPSWWLVNSSLWLALDFKAHCTNGDIQKRCIVFLMLKSLEYRIFSTHFIKAMHASRCPIWTNAGILSIRPLGTDLGEILIAIHIFSLKKMHLKMSSAKWRPLCLCPNVIKYFRPADEFGQRRPPWFLFMPSYWCVPKAGLNSRADCNGRAEQIALQQHDEAVMEPIPIDLRGKEAIRSRKINPLHDKFVRGNKNIHLYFMSLLQMIWHR